MKAIRCLKDHINILSWCSTNDMTSNGRLETITRHEEDKMFTLRKHSTDRCKCSSTQILAITTLDKDVYAKQF